MYAVMLTINLSVFKVCGPIKLGNSSTAHTYVPLFLIAGVFWYVPNSKAWHHFLAGTWIFWVVIAGLHVSALLLSVNQNHLLVLGGFFANPFSGLSKLRFFHQLKGFNFCVQFTFVQCRDAQFSVLQLEIRILKFCGHSLEHFIFTSSFKCLQWTFPLKCFASEGLLGVVNRVQNTLYSHNSSSIAKLDRGWWWWWWVLPEIFCCKVRP